MQANQQQVAGGMNYSSNTRIGNWQETIAIDEGKRELFFTKSLNGNLALRKQEQKIAKCTEAVPHSYSPDGFVRFGDYVILSHDSSGSILACDPYDELFQNQQKYLVTGLKAPPVPQARNTFKIVPPPARFMNLNDDESDSILRIGQAFCLVCNESLLSVGSNILNPTLYLCSTKKNERMATKISNRQLVFMSPQNDADSIWQLVLPSHGRLNGSERFLSLGRPVTVDDSVQLTHRQTNMYLTCDPKQQFQTEFGIEMECFADRSAAVGKLGLLVSEFKGISTTQTLSKPDAEIFSWHFVLSNSESTAADSRSLPPAASIDVIIKEVRSYMKYRGVDGFWQLREYFHQLESNVSSEGKFYRDDLKDALVEFGFPIEGRHLQSLVDLMDKKNTGLVDWREFIKFIRGPLSSRRRQLVEEVYVALDTKRQGAVSFEDLRRFFRGSRHPLVVECGFTEEQAFTHLQGFFNARGGRPMKAATSEVFLEYYADLSANIDGDSEFEASIKDTWGAK